MSNMDHHHAGFRAKNIILCSDGTGNSMTKNRGSNVWKLYEAIDLGETKEGVEQIVFYDDGVGSEGFKPLQAVAGAFGLGLSSNVKQLYKHLCLSYRTNSDMSETDNIYLFGFSRGAYTVRVLAGLISLCGILKGARSKSIEALDDEVELAYTTFRHIFTKVSMDDLYQQEANVKAEVANEDAEVIEKKEQKLEEKKVKLKAEIEETVNSALDKCRKFKEKHSIKLKGDGPIRIKFMGVWDTVVAYGLPFKGLTDYWSKHFFAFKFPDHELGTNVDKACHALAIDDQRLTFHPLLWDERNEDPSKPDRVEQRWFMGMHSNVGGGYPRHGLSLIALNWMIKRSEKEGLVYLKPVVQNYKARANAHDKMYDSRAGLAQLYRYKPRNIITMCHKYKIPIVLDPSVKKRLSLTTENYAPLNLYKNFIDPNDKSKKTPYETTYADIIRRGKIHKWTVYSGLIIITAGIVLSIIYPLLDTFFTNTLLYTCMTIAVLILLLSFASYKSTNARNRISQAARAYWSERS